MWQLATTFCDSFSLYTHAVPSVTTTVEQWLRWLCAASSERFIASSVSDCDAMENEEWKSKQCHLSSWKNSSSGVIFRPDMSISSCRAMLSGL